MTQEARTPRPFWRRRWLWAVVALLVASRAALPEVLRRTLVSRVSETLATRVEVGDVDLALHRGGITLEDVALYSPTPQTADKPPLVAWKRFTVEVRYLPFLWKTLQLRTITLDAPRVVLDRLASGELNLQRLVPATESEKTTDAPPGAGERPGTESSGGMTAGEAGHATGSAWRIGVDRFQLISGGVSFRDLTLPEGKPLEISLPDITVESVALQPGLYGEPARARLRLKSEGARIRVDSQLDVLESGVAVGTRIKARRLPLERARLYIPGVGWSELRGECALALEHRLAPAPTERNDIQGMVRLRDVAVRIPDLQHAAFTLQHLAVRIDPVDLKARRARVRAVDINGASVVADLQGGEVLPLLRRSAATEGAPAELAAEPAAVPEDPSRARPWHWELGSLTLDDSRVSLLQDGAPLHVGVEIAVRDLADDAEAPGHVAVNLAVGPGSLALAGAARVEPPGFGGTVRIEQLPIRDLAHAARAARQFPPGLLRAATLAADLVVEAGIDEQGATPTEPHALRVRGTIAVDGLDLAGADPKEFGAGWKRLTVPIDEIRVPGIMPEAPDAAKTTPLRVAFGAIRLEDPFVHVTRTAAGILLPSSLGGAPATGEPPETNAAEAEPPAAKPAPVSSDDSPPRPLEATIASFVLSRGRIGFADRTVKPFFSGEITPLEVDARGITLVGAVVSQFALSAGTPQHGTIRIAGTLRPYGSSIEIDATEVALAPYNPFVTAYSPYSLGAKSSLSVHSEVTATTRTYDSETSLRLHRLTVKGAEGDTLFTQQFGIPLSMALALLRDLSGDIKLDVPVTVEESGTKIALGTVIGGALRGALMGAITSPLKLIGGVFGTDGVITSPSLVFPVGRAALAPEGERQVEQLATFLAGRPGVALELDAVVTPADVRWIAEQDLRAELDARAGVVNALRGLAERGARLRIQQALAERAGGEPGELSAEDLALLDQWLTERAPVTPERPRALATERTSAIATLLRDRHGIDASRVTTGEAHGEAVEGEPAVKVAFGAVGN